MVIYQLHYEKMSLHRKTAHSEMYSWRNDGRDKMTMGICSNVLMKHLKGKDII
jgi:hypothetical protein